jgi:hypothetical protein
MQLIGFLLIMGLGVVTKSIDSILVFSGYLGKGIWGIELGYQRDYEIS